MSKGTTEELMADVNKELEVLRKCRHENIVQYYGSFRTKHRYGAGGFEGEGGDGAKPQASRDPSLTASRPTALVPAGRRAPRACGFSWSSARAPFLTSCARRAPP